MRFRVRLGLQLGVMFPTVLSRRLLGLFSVSAKLMVFLYSLSQKQVVILDLRRVFSVLMNVLMPFAFCVLDLFDRFIELLTVGTLSAVSRRERKSTLKICSDES